MSMSFPWFFSAKFKHWEKYFLQRLHQSVSAARMLLLNKCPNLHLNARTFPEPIVTFDMHSPPFEIAILVASLSWELLILPYDLGSGSWLYSCLIIISREVEAGSEINTALFRRNDINEDEDSSSSSSSRSPVPPAAPASD